MEPCSRCGRRLPVDPRQPTVEARPARRTGSPHRQRRPRQAGVVKRPNPNEYQVRSGFGFAKERRSARSAEPSPHSIPAVRNTEVVGSFSSAGEARRTKARVHCATATAKVLAVAAPTHSRHYRRLRACPTNQAAKALTRYRHVGRSATFGQNDRRAFASQQMPRLRA